MYNNIYINNNNNNNKLLLRKVHFPHFAHTPKPRVIENPLDAGIAFEERSVRSEQSVWVAQISA